ncbi:hypothetical protein [uncultured Aquimarina sp.]|uniref:hypothetical protein n=1 Tax=uncultured Aquimarina sp. TaxID=575652 RepID=UPI002638F3BA|nr:hypothetical protein [uncultured Aquimarina sp.]
MDFTTTSKGEMDIFNSNCEMVSLRVLKNNSKNTDGVLKREKGFVKKYNQIIKKLQFHPLYLESNYKEKHLVKKYVERMIDTQLYGSIKIGVLAVDFLRAQNKDSGRILGSFKAK